METRLTTELVRIALHALLPSVSPSPMPVFGLGLVRAFRVKKNWHGALVCKNCTTEPPKRTATMTTVPMPRTRVVFFSLSPLCRSRVPFSWGSLHAKGWKAL